MSLNNHVMKGTQNNYRMMIDSGTTFSYFPRPLFDLIKVHFQWFCGMDPQNNCKGKMSFQQEGYLCWDYDGSLFTDGPSDFFKSLPILRFFFDAEDGSTYSYDWYPSEYLYKETDGSYCMAADI
jgi:hypothetical protein